MPRRVESRQRGRVLVQTILEHVKQTKADAAKFSNEILRIAGPRIMDVLVSAVQPPRLVPDLPAQSPAGTGTDG